MIFRRVWLGAGAGLGLALATASAPAVAATTWDYYGITGVTHPVSIFLKGFCDEVTKRTNGELKITFRPAGELPFRATEAANIAAQGVVQMSSAYAGFISGTVPKAAIAGHPFLVRTYDDLAKVWPIIDKYTQPEFKKIGVKVLFHFAWPPQNFYGVGKPIKTSDDFAGRKLRVTDPKQAEMLKRLGATSVTLTTAEVPVAMERGLMEGVATAAFNIIGAKWYEFVKWGWISELHIGGPNYELVNLQAYEALDPKVRATLDQVAAEWQAKMLKQIAALEAKNREDLVKKYGVELNTASPGDIAKVTRLMTPYWEEWAKENHAEEMMKEVRAALGK